MKKTIAFIVLSFMSSNVFACSGKNRVNFDFTTNTKNVSHATYASLGKDLFNSSMLSKEIHAYSTPTNHSMGYIGLDYTTEKQKEALIIEVKNLLKKNDFILVRSSDEKLLERGK
ncbi:hypothetical protein [Photobacterium leiognathi]|uniref:hypothetical protein n=1 Tax=Photobacterium leiognathi TaxID=553611 RepID=UPI002980F25F|nr:hypothetical protein [Photobacterium leiognathi]